MERRCIREEPARPLSASRTTDHGRFVPIRGLIIFAREAPSNAIQHYIHLALTLAYETCLGIETKVLAQSLPRLCPGQTEMVRCVVHRSSRAYPRGPHGGPRLWPCVKFVFFTVTTMESTRGSIVVGLRQVAIVDMETGVLASEIRVDVYCLYIHPLVAT